MLIDNVTRLFPDDLVHVDAHFRLAEAHAAAGEVDASWAHYVHARDVCSLTERTQPHTLPELALEFCLGLGQLAYDYPSAKLMPDVDALLVSVLAEVDDQLAECEHIGVETDVLRLRKTTIEMMRSTYLGDVEATRSLLHLLVLQRFDCVGDVPPQLDRLVRQGHLSLLLAEEQRAFGRASVAHHDRPMWTVNGGPADREVCAHVTQGLFERPQRRAASGRTRTGQEMSVSSRWTSAAEHARLVFAWCSGDLAALDRAASESWADSDVLDRHLVGALHFLGMLQTYYTQSRPGADGVDACTAMTDRLLAHRSEADMTSVLAMIGLVRTDGGVFQAPTPRTIGHVRDLLYSFLVAEADLLDFVTTEVGDSVLGLSARLVNAAIHEAG